MNSQQYLAARFASLRVSDFPSATLVVAFSSLDAPAQLEDVWLKYDVDRCASLLKEAEVLLILADTAVK